MVSMDRRFAVPFDRSSPSRKRAKFKILNIPKKNQGVGSQNVTSLPASDFSRYAGHFALLGTATYGMKTTSTDQVS
jgi:hypothetical protein